MPFVAWSAVAAGSADLPIGPLAVVPEVAVIAALMPPVRAAATRRAVAAVADTVIGEGYR